MSGLSPYIGRLADVKAIVKLSRSTIDRLESRGDFPRRRQLSKGAVGWDLAEVRDWWEKRPRGPKSPAGRRVAK
jgi:predicted DNA-binding transcriptional regulator AlpA